MEKTTDKSWYEREEFWKTFSPVLFNNERMQSAGQEVEQIVSLLKLQPGTRVCDLCCGVGRHSLELGHLGFCVTGVDRTGSYIEEAQKKADEQGLNIRLVQEDMRSFCEPNAFEAVINVFTSFGFFEDAAEDKLVIQNVYESLKEGGKFLVDIIGKEVLARIFRDKRWFEENGVVVLEESKLSEDWSTVDCRWIVIRDGKWDEFRFTLRLYSASRLSDLLKSCGFGKVEIYGDFRGSPYDLTAKRLVVVARK